MTDKPNIDGSVIRAIEALELYHHTNDGYERKPITQALTDLRAFVDALPDDLENNLSQIGYYTKDFSLIKPAVEAAKLTAKAVRGE